MASAASRAPAARSARAAETAGSAAAGSRAARSWPAITQQQPAVGDPQGVERGRGREGGDRFGRTGVGADGAQERRPGGVGDRVGIGGVREQHGPVPGVACEVVAERVGGAEHREQPVPGVAAGAQDGPQPRRVRGSGRRGTPRRAAGPGPPAPGRDRRRRAGRRAGRRRRGPRGGRPGPPGRGRRAARLRVRVREAQPRQPPDGGDVPVAPIGHEAALATSPAVARGTADREEGPGVGGGERVELRPGAGDLPDHGRAGRGRRGAPAPRPRGSSR